MPRNRTRIRYCGRVRKNRFGLADAVFRLLLPRRRSALSAPDTSLLTSVFQTQRRISRRRTPCYGFVGGGVGRRILTGEAEGALPGVRVGAVLYPAVLLALADGRASPLRFPSRLWSAPGSVAVCRVGKFFLFSIFPHEGRRRGKRRRHFCLGVLSRVFSFRWSVSG